MNKMCNVHTNRFPISLFFCEVWSFWSQNFIYSLNKVTVCRDNSLLHLLLCFARINFARIQNSVMCIGLGNFDSCISWKFWPVWTLLKIVINSMSAKLFVNQWTKLQESWCILRTHLQSCIWSRIVIWWWSDVMFHFLIILWICCVPCQSLCVAYLYNVGEKCTWAC